MVCNKFVVEFNVPIESGLTTWLSAHPTRFMLDDQILKCTINKSENNKMSRMTISHENCDNVWVSVTFKWPSNEPINDRYGDYNNDISGFIKTAELSLPAINICESVDDRESIYAVSNLTNYYNSDFSRAQFPNVKKLTFSGETYVDIKKLTSLTDLEVLNCGDQNKVVNLELINSLPNLKFLAVYNTPLTSVEIDAISSLTNLEELILYKCGITPSNIAPLNKLRKLKYLDLEENEITDECISDLFCRINTNFLHPLSSKKGTYVSPYPRCEY